MMISITNVVKFLLRVPPAKLLAGLFLVTVFVRAMDRIESRGRQLRRTKLAGSVMGVPYDFRPPTIARIKERFWNPRDPRVLTPKVFGIGWSVNMPSLVNRLRRRRR